MQTYICKCGKTFEKSSKADTTGYVLTDYSPQHECFGCPYIVTERDWQTKEIVKRECRATPKITYLTRCHIGTGGGDFSYCYIYSLDLVFIKRVLNFVNTLDGAEHHNHTVPEEWRAADFGKCYRSDNCCGLAIFPLIFKKNKLGTEARRAVKDRFFTNLGYYNAVRKDMTEEQEKEIIMQRIEIAKENARNDCESCGYCSNDEEEPHPKEDKTMVGPAFNFGSFISESNTLKQLPLNLLVPRHNHRFKLYDGERLQDMVQSIRSNGVLTPIIVMLINDELVKLIESEMNAADEDKKVKLGEAAEFYRSHLDKYEILAGHNRCNAAQLAGKTSVPGIVKENLSYDEAEMYVAETNFMQRGFDDLSITERAAVLAARHSAMFDEDKRNAIVRELAILNGEEVENTADGEKKSKLAAVGENYGLSKDTVARLIRIDKLVPELKSYVDEGRIAVRAAVNLSYLFSSEQRKVAELIDFGVDMKKSALLREVSRQNKLNDNAIHEILITGRLGNAPVAKRKPIRVKIDTEISDKYFSPDWDEARVQDIINLALEQYFSKTGIERDGGENLD